MKHRKLLSLGVDATAPVIPPPAAPQRGHLPPQTGGWIANPSPPRTTSQVPDGLSGWIA